MIVEVIIEVSPTSIHLQVDGKEIISWEGDPKRLSLPPEDTVIRRMPNPTWPWLAAWHTQYRVSEFTIEVLE